MQKLTYVNVYGESIEFGGEPPILLRSVSGFSRPDASVVSTQGAYQAGAMLHRLQLPTRMIQMQFDILPQESREALYQLRMKMERVLASGRCMKDGKTGLLIYENDAGRWQMDAVPDGTITYGKRFRDAIAGSKLNFLCPNPYLLSDQVNLTHLRMGAGGFKLPAKLPAQLGIRKFTATLVNDGTVDAPMTITIYGTGETPKVVNHTTGAEIIVSRSVADGERLVIHTDPLTLSCELHKADGMVEDAFGYLDPSVAVSAFVLKPGSNEVEYVPSIVSTGSRVDLEWRAYYEGV